MSERGHDLKCWPEPFAAVRDGSKTHEIRRDDRDYAAGDLLLLREWDPLDRNYTGERCLVRVTHMTPGGTWGLSADLCVLSIRREQVWQCSGCRAVAFGPWRDRCPACGRYGFLTGSVHSDAIRATLAGKAAH